jgi:hypothetical protein
MSIQHALQSKKRSNGSVMPRKRWRSKLTTLELPTVNQKDCNAVSDHDLVRHALVDFDELNVLSPKVLQQLVEELVLAIRYRRCGLRAQKRGVSDKALATQVFFADVRRALESSGIPAKRWRKRYDNGGGESLYYRIAREIADVSGINVPKDPKLAGRVSAQFQYGALSLAMDTAQTLEKDSVGKSSSADGSDVP